MKIRKLLFITLLFATLIVNTRAQSSSKGTSNENVSTENQSSLEVIEIRENESKNNMGGASFSPDKAFKEICNCRVKLKLLNKKFWLPDSVSYKELAFLIKSGGRVLKTKPIRNLQKERALLPKELFKAGFNTLPNLIASINCEDWKCKVLKLFRHFFGWVIKLGQQEIDNSEQKKETKP